MNATPKKGPASAAKSRSRRQTDARIRAEAMPGPARDFRGYGAHPPHAAWPGGARIAVNLNLNVEAGGEHCLLEADDASEHILTDIGFPPYSGTRSPMVESVFEHGPRVGAGACCAFSGASISRSAFSALSAACNNIPN
jgi:allantoinase